MVLLQYRRFSDTTWLEQSFPHEADPQVEETLRDSQSCSLSCVQNAGEGSSCDFTPQAINAGFVNYPG